ncbi:MAG: polysaccharide biosynthesis tyrosine autokinase [Alphaproteobacteria bacterium]|nr:polysaccharide biosynthesis tyrosine autokinase [Alphaproteobacteria bacterium]
MNQHIDRRRVSREAPAVVFQDIDIKEILLVLWRSRKIIAGLTILFVILAAAWLSFQTPEYSTHAVLQINSRESKVLGDTEEVLSRVGQEAAAVESEVDILKSAYIAGRVVDRLELTKQEEFNWEMQGPGLIGVIKQRILGKKEVNPEQHAEYLRNSAIEILMNKVYISRSPNSLTIKVYARSENPNMAQKIANTLVEEYLNDQQESHFDAAKNANSWLTSRLDELQNDLAKSEQAVQAYREKHNLFDTQGLTVNDQQLSELNSQLILARAERAEIEAKLRRTKQLVNTSGGIESASEVLNSPLIQKLREQEADLAQNEADLATRYGPKHPKMIKTHAGLKDLHQKIDREIQKVINSMANEAAVARTRERSLEKSLKGAQSEVGQTSAAEIKLAELIRETETNKKLYESFLSRSKETAQQQDLETADARIISKATQPYKPTHPKKKLVLVMAIAAGLGLGVCIALLLEHLDNTFRTVGQVERQTGYVALGTLPKLEKPLSPLSYFREKPTSHFAENLRKIQSSIHFSSSEKPPQVVMITSSLTGEGKSILTLSLAQSAIKAGLKTIVLDGDMRRPMVARYLKSDFKNTLSEVLSGKIKWQQALTEDQESGIHFLPSTPNTENSNELLGAKAMDTLLKELREHYDLILLDTPPIGALVDALTVARKVDSTVFAVHWGETAKSLIQESLKPLQMYRLPVAGLVLTQVDVQKDKAYGYGNYYTGYNAYYHD